MVRGVSLPFLGLLLSFAFAAGAGGGYLAGRFRPEKSPLPETSVPNPAPKDIVLHPVVNPVPVVPVAVKALPAKPEPKSVEIPAAAKVPTFDEVEGVAMELARRLVAQEPDATQKRINREASLSRRLTMQRVNRASRGRITDISDLGMVELYQSTALGRSYVWPNESFKAMRVAHYEMSKRNGTLNRQEEALWTVSAWIACGDSVSEQWMAGSCDIASYYYANGSTPSRSEQVYVELYNRIISFP